MGRFLSWLLGVWCLLSGWSVTALALGALLENRQGGVVAWNTWHVSDAVGWHTEWHPSLFDADCRAKPAYYAIQEELARATRDAGR